MEVNETPRRIRILLVDDHSVLRKGVGLILNAEPDLEVVGEAGSGEDALLVFRQHRPEVTLMDLKMKGLSGIDAILAIRAEFPAARILILSTYDRDDDIYRSIRAGAMGYLVKDAPAEEIASAIRSVSQGLKHFPPAISGKLAGRLMKPDLSQRELEVLRLLIAGQSNKEIAETLCVALGTVKYHINNILTKLEAEDRIQAVLIALRSGLADLE